MGSETALWQTMRTNVYKVFDKVHLQRHEDIISVGIPDVSYGVRYGFNDFRQGWVELKYTAEYPARPGTPIKCDHFTQEQKDWLGARGSLGGRCCVLWQVDKDYYVFGWQVVWDLGTLSKSEMKDVAYWYCLGRPDWCKVMNAISET